MHIQLEKYMKKILISLLLIFSIIMSLASCTINIGLQNNSANDICEHEDIDNDGKCEFCGTTLELCDHIDIDDDGKCEFCGTTMSNGGGETGGTDSGENGGNNSGTGGNDGGTNGDGCANHKDEDDNGYCDTCEVYVIEIFDFYVLNDLHGKFTDGDNHPGVDELTTYLKNKYETEDNVIILSSGDMWQGGSESNLTKGLIITEWMNELDFVAMALGNHEFDWGEEYIIKNAELAEFPLLAINIYDKSTNKRVEYCESSVMVELDGVKIGIIGAIGDCYGSILNTNVADLYFKVGAELTALVKAESEKLRKEGADFIIYSLHDGYDNTTSSSGVSSLALSGYYDSELSSGGYVDLVFEGHTHQRYAFADTYGIYHLQNGGENKGISHVEVKINYANGNSSIITAEFISTSTYSGLEDDPIIEELLNKYENLIAKGDEVLGKNKSYMDDSVLEELVAKLYYEFGVEKWGDKYDIVLGFNSSNTRSPYNLAAGNVTYGDLLSLLPFDNHITLCAIRGSDLKSRIINNTKDGVVAYMPDSRTIEDNKTYYIVVDTWTSDYSYYRCTVVEKWNEAYFARDLVADYIKKGGLA